MPAGREKQSTDHAGSRTAPIIETMIEILAPASPVARGMVMTDDDIEFDEADLARLQRLEAMMQDRGYRRDQRGFWVLPGAELCCRRQR